MSDTSKIVESVAAALVNLADDLDPGDIFGCKLIEASRDAKHSGDCTHESHSCLRCGYELKTTEAREFLAAIGLRADLDAKADVEGLVEALKTSTVLLDVHAKEDSCEMCSEQTRTNKEAIALYERSQQAETER